MRHGDGVDGREDARETQRQRIGVQMKALVLAAGKGSRLRPLTNTIPKHLLPVGSKPILFHVLDQIVEAGITDIGIVVSPDSGPYIEEAINESGQCRAEIAFISQSKPLGLAHAVSVAKEFVGDSDFLVFLGDNLIQEGVGSFLDEFRASSAEASIILKEVPDPRAFGVAEVDASGKVISMVEKPREPKSNLAIIGVYLFTPEIHEAIAQVEPSWRGELEITDAIQKLMDMGKEIRSHLLQGWWLDIGSNDGLIEANRVFLDTYLQDDVRGETDPQSRIAARVQVEEGTRIERSSVEGPVLIGANCRIADSVIKPFTNIGAGTVIEDSSLERSVIMGNCHISGVNSLVGSVIGKNSSLTMNRKCPDVLSVFVGDDSKVELR